MCAPRTSIFHFHLLTSPLSFPSYQVKELELEGHLEPSTKSLPCVNLPSSTINISRNKTFYNSSRDVVKSFQCSWGWAVLLPDGHCISYFLLLVYSLPTLSHSIQVCHSSPFSSFCIQYFSIQVNLCCFPCISTAGFPNVSELLLFICFSSQHP